MPDRRATKVQAMTPAEVDKLRKSGSPTSGRQSKVVRNRQRGAIRDHSQFPRQGRPKV